MNDALPVAEPRTTPPAPRTAWIALALAGLIAAALLAFQVRGGPFAWDRAIMLRLRIPGDTAQPIGPAWLHEAMVEITALGSGTILTCVVVAVAGLLLVQRMWLTAVLVLAATLIGSTVAGQAKYWVGRPRPELVDHLVQVTGLSFPSGHATNSAIIYLTLAGLVAQVARGRVVRRYVLGLAAVLVGAIGISRVYLGVHWPSDVLAGWCAGTGWAALWWWIAAAVRARLAQRR
ncbi:undecaprenyl-diphosphatase [Sphingomonas sp. BE138]|uniref:phosphatase PAP2 family protein n=1 Tax=Sphingomonas sp. BE138 TaxID=2817845 RepID=UPI0028668793|nr:phosphatase PAP2 family protein [Sphingomonas sp. BE138]MDR6789369.1 undecaprenyl-diphosphatase [Sphingomonas sp. BE138]